jgi:hypothetical protein
MKRSTRGSWWGLYALVPISVALLYVAATVKAGETVHLILLSAVSVAVPILGLLWSERHADLMGSEGVDARAEEESLAATGVETRRLAPSLTARQAHYRGIMLARSADECHNRTNGSVGKT